MLYDQIDGTGSYINLIKHLSKDILSIVLDNNLNVQILL